MKMGLWKSAVIAGALFLTAGQADGAKSALYPGPAGISPSEDYAVLVDGKPLFVYPVQLNDNTPNWTPNPSPHTG